MSCVYLDRRVDILFLDVLLLFSAILNETPEEQKSRRLFDGAILWPHWSIIKHYCDFMAFLLDCLYMN